MKIDQTTASASLPASERSLTRKAQAIQEAIESGQDVNAVIKREEAIERAEHERRMRYLELASW